MTGWHWDLASLIPLWISGVMCGVAMALKASDPKRGSAERVAAD